MRARRVWVPGLLVLLGGAASALAAGAPTGNSKAIAIARAEAHAYTQIRVETYTVTFDREGRPERGIVACRTARDDRAWANVLDADLLAQLCAEEGIGRTGTLGADGMLALDD